LTRGRATDSLQNGAHSIYSNCPGFASNPFTFHLHTFNRCAAPAVPFFYPSSHASHPFIWTVDPICHGRGRPSSIFRSKRTGKDRTVVWPTRLLPHTTQGTRYQSLCHPRQFRSSEVQNRYRLQNSPETRESGDHLTELPALVRWLAVRSNKEVKHPYRPICYKQGSPSSQLTAVCGL
jgi:hypothetical protein